MSDFVLPGRDPRADPPTPLPVMRLEPVQRDFRHVAALTPAKTALEHEAASWTYGELESTSARLGALLVAHGVGRGDVVAIVADRSPAFVCGMLGVLEAGAGFALIDHAFASSRVAASVEQARPRHVLLAGEARVCAGSLARGVGVTCLPDTLAEMAALVAPYGAAASPDVTATDVAYLSFTSDRTGAPRCVGVSHAPLPRFIDWQRAEFALGADDHFALLSDLSDDPVLCDVFTPLSIGATLHLPAQRLLLDPPALFAWMRERRITASHLSVATGRVLLAGAGGRRLPDLRRLFWGGEALPAAIVSALAEVAPQARQVELYGTTDPPQPVGCERAHEVSGLERISIGRGMTDVGRGRDAARTAKEQVLAQLWSEVLGVPEVGRNETFYDLGGDSLTALRVMVRMQTLGLDEAVCRQILHGKTIAEIAGDGLPQADGGATPQERGDPCSPLLLNVVRGLMVALVVGAHWLDALFRRWPDLLPSTVFTPLLNGSTPGFAIAFGMTLGFVHYPAYRQSPARARTLLRRGATLVGGGVLLYAADQLVFNSLGHGAMHPLSSPLLYYVLALVTAPAWLALLGSARDLTRRAAGLAVLFEVVHQGLRTVPWPKGSWVWAHYALGEYSYFNLSAGTMLGLILGFALRRRHGVPSWYVPAGLAFAVLGAMLSFEPDRVPLIEPSVEVEIWKWLFYGGLLLVVLRGIDRWLRAKSRARRPLAALARVTGTVGQLAFPLFILDFASRDLSKVCDLAGAPQLRLVTGAAMFAAGSGYLVTKAYRLYYGFGGEAGALGDEVRVMLPEA